LANQDALVPTEFLLLRVSSIPVWPGSLSKIVQAALTITLRQERAIVSSFIWSFALLFLLAVLMKKVSVWFLACFGCVLRRGFPWHKGE
jgi:hypothetical protein